MRDDFHEQEPGKILHELRFGELTASGERPHSPYFGTADATPLFLVLLDEYHRWTGDDELVRELEPNARAALDWIDDSGDADGDGYVEYACRNPATGPGQPVLEGQLGLDPVRRRLARARARSRPARSRVTSTTRSAAAARLAREVWGDEALADRLERQAGTLRAASTRDFWMPERGCHALALDGEKRQVDSLTSNIGHLLWSGLLDEREAAATAERLLDEELYSGWGVRTLGADEAGYNPLGYHTGHRLAPRELADRRRPCALRPPRRGRHDRRRDARAAPHFEHRLPEVFAGYPVGADVRAGRLSDGLAAAGLGGRHPLLLLTTLLDLQPGSADADCALEAIGEIKLRARRSEVLTEQRQTQSERSWSASLDPTPPEGG